MSELLEYLDSTAADLLSRCTECGRCVEVCPIVPLVELADAKPAEVIAQVKRLTEGKSYSAEARRFTEACNGSGQCNAACPEGINVRQWLSIAKLKLKTELPEAERSLNSGQQFRRMAQALHLLASMQLPSEDLKRILAPAKSRTADLVFYYGCNVLRSPHIIFNVMDVLDALDLEYEVLGGTANCCGVVQFMAGDLKTYERIAPKTYGALSGMGAKTVISWCPTCQLQFGETYHDYARPSFDVGHVAEFLAGYRDKIAERIVKPLPKRAVIHEHGGVKGVVESTRRLMEIIPGLQIVDVPQNREFGYQCSRVAQYPEKQNEVHRIIAENAKAAGVDLIITIYHGCHRQLCGAEGQYPYEVKNFTDVLAEALGAGRPDLYKAYKIGGDVYEAIRSAGSYLEQNGVRVKGMDDLLQRELFGEPGISGSPSRSEEGSFST